MIRLIYNHKYIFGFLSVLAFFFFTFLAFGHSLYQGFAPIDDIFLIVENIAIRGITWENIRHVFSTYDPELYIPLVFISYQLNWLFSGLQPFGYHLTNILLHALNALLVSRILFQLSGKKYLAIFAGLIFAVHPLHTEAVVWLAGRKDLLAGLFFFAAFTCYLDSIKGSRIAYVFSIIFFLLALLSKVVAVTMFGIIVLHFLLIDRGKLSKFKIAGFIPYAVLALIFMVIAIGGKARIVVSVSFWDQILVAGKSTTFYIYKFIFPTDLTIIYPLQGDISLFSEEIFPFALFSVILVLAAIYSWRKYPWFSFAVGWYVITLSPTYLNIGKAGLVFFAVDRYAYLPSVGLLFLFIVMAGAVFKNINIFQYSHPYFKKVLVIFIGISIIAGCVWLSRKQTHVWDSPEALYLKSLSVYPESVGARVGLSTIYRRQNKLTDSFEVLREGLKYGDYSLLHLHAGYIYAKNGQINEALERFKIASEKDTKNPEPIFAIGSLYEQINDIENAILFYNKAIALDGSYVVVRSKLGMLYLNKNKMQEAYEQFKAALKWNRNSYEANFGMAKLLEKEGKTSEAQTYIRKAELAEKYGLTP